jgi:hypothetical protein
MRDDEARVQSLHADLHHDALHVARHARIRVAARRRRGTPMGARIDAKCLVPGAERRPLRIPLAMIETKPVQQEQRRAAPRHVEEEIAAVGGDVGHGNAPSAAAPRQPAVGQCSMRPGGSPAAGRGPEARRRARLGKPLGLELRPLSGRSRPFAGRPANRATSCCVSVLYPGALTKVNRADHLESRRSICYGAASL